MEKRALCTEIERLSISSSLFGGEEENCLRTALMKMRSIKVRLIQVRLIQVRLIQVPLYTTNKNSDNKYDDVTNEI